MAEPRFLRACRRKQVDRVPVWMMRQAGRYMSEYRRLRERYDMLEICRTPELALEVTLQPIKRFDLDAAIIFADILLPLEGMGVPFGFKPNHGPVIHEPVDTLPRLEKVRQADIEKSLGYVLESLRLVRSELDESIALIGFAGAPFTLASYMIEGGSSRNYLKTKSLMYAHPEAWHRLMETVSQTTWRYLAAQAQAGAQALQLFDSWVGCLSPEDYDEYVFPHVRRIFAQLAGKGVPLIYFGTGTATLLRRMSESGAQVLGVDWRVPLAEAFRIAGERMAVQGNLDPAALFAPRDALLRKTRQVLDQAGGRRGYIFNLGHGILPKTPVENVGAVIDYVHQQGG